MRKRSMLFQLIIFLTVVAAALTTLQAEDWNFVARLNRALDDIVPIDAKITMFASCLQGRLHGNWPDHCSCPGTYQSKCFGTD